jgi:hypothetical protein
VENKEEELQLSNAVNVLSKVQLALFIENETEGSKTTAV